MARPQVRTLLDTEEGREHLIWLHENKCKHSMDYWSHWGCYEKECPISKIEEKIGFLDIEASNLKADFGVVLSWCILPRGGKAIRSGVISKLDVARQVYDKRIIEDLLKVIWLYDRLVTHYGARFDIPFLRTRAIRWRIDDKFPKPGQLYHTDMWRVSKDKLCISSNRQDAISRALVVPDIKTRIHPDIWLDVQMRQSKSGLNYILDHNKKDVIQLKNNFELLLPHLRLTKASI